MRATPGLHRVRAAGPTPVDLAVAIVAFVGLLALSATVSDGASRFAHTGWGALNPVGVGLVALSALPVAGWRWAPFGVFVLTGSASAILAALDYGPGLPIGPAVALYLLAAGRDQTTPWTRRATIAVVGLFVAYVAATLAANAASPGIDVGHMALAWAVAWFAGERTRLRREQLAELRERAAGAERDAERERLLAVAEERARIARDLHDSAGHAINVIAVRAGAARLRHERHDSERSLAALAAIEELARQTAAEIDEFVGALRVGSAAEAVEAPPGLASLDTLVAQHTASGLAVALTTSGVPRPLTGGSDQAAFRILQEALTNAARHGTGAVRVELAFDDEAFEVVVTNDIPSGASVRTSGGHGLVGMGERARLLGGALAAEAHNGVFRVCAQLPRAGAGR